MIWTLAIIIALISGDSHEMEFTGPDLSTNSLVVYLDERTIRRICAGREGCTGCDERLRYCVSHLVEGAHPGLKKHEREHTAGGRDR